MKQIRKKILPLTKQILIAIACNASDAWQNNLDLAPHHGFNQLIFGDTISYKVEEKFQQRQRLKRALASLRQREYLEIKKKGDMIFYQLTQKGLNDAILAKIKTQTKKISKNQFCIICFDIPESIKGVRRALRHFLKMAGFQQLQKSIWYTNKDIFDDVKKYILSLKAKEWVRVILASTID